MMAEDLKEEILRQVAKSRRYIDDPSEAPEGVEVHQGERKPDAFYYYTEDVESDNGESEEEGNSWDGGLPPVSPGDKISYTLDGSEEGGVVDEVGYLTNKNPYIWVEEEGQMGHARDRILTYTDERGWFNLNSKYTDFSINTEETDGTPPDESEVTDMYEDWNRATLDEWVDYGGYGDDTEPFQEDEVPFSEVDAGDKVRVKHAVFGGEYSTTSYGDKYRGDEVKATVLHKTPHGVLIETEDGSRATVEAKSISQVKRQSEQDFDVDPLSYEEISVDSRFEEIPDDVTYGRTRNVENLRGQYDDRVVDYVENIMEMWGQLDYSQPAMAEMWTAAAKMEGKEPPDFAQEEVGRVWDTAVFQAMADLMRMNREAAKQDYGEETTLYRGISESAIEKYGEVTDDGVTIEPNALESWTQKSSLSEEFGGVVLKNTFNMDNVGFYRSDELTLMGHGPYTIPWENIHGYEQ